MATAGAQKRDANAHLCDLQDARQAAVTQLTQQVVQDQLQHAQQHPAQDSAAADGKDDSEASLTGCSPLMVCTSFPA